MAQTKQTSLLSTFLWSFILSVISFFLLLGGALWIVSSMAMNTSAYRALRSTPTLGHILPNVTDRVLPKDFYYFNMTKYSHNPKHDLGLDYESVDILSQENTTIRGWFVPAKNNDCSKGENPSTVVLVHGAFVDRREMLRHVKFLNENGYHTILYDARDHGISDHGNRGCSLGVREHQDIISVIDYITDKKKENIGKNIAVLGSSNGAASAIMAAAKDKRIMAVIAENPFNSRINQLRYAMRAALKQGQWGREKLSNLSTIGKIVNNIRTWIPDWFIELAVLVTNARMGGIGMFEAIDVVQDIMPRGLLLIHGDADLHVLVDHSRELYAKAAHPSVELWIVPGGDHGRILNQFEKEYVQKVLRFLDKYISKCS